MASSSGARRADSTYRSTQQRYLENREKDLTLPWRHWLRERYARYWYGLACFALDLIAAGTVLQVGTGSPPDAWQYALAIVLVLVLSYVEYRGYQRLWPLPPLE